MADPVALERRCDPDDSQYSFRSAVDKCYGSVALSKKLLLLSTHRWNATTQAPLQGPDTCTHPGSGTTVSHCHSGALQPHKPLTTHSLKPRQRMAPNPPFSPMFCLDGLKDLVVLPVDGCDLGIL